MGSLLRMTRHAAGNRTGAVHAKGPVLDREEAAILRPRQALPSSDQEMRADLAVFLAQVEGSATVTAAHIAAATDIADGNTLATVPDSAVEGSGEARSSAATKSLPAGRTRRWMVAILAACILIAGLAAAMLPELFDRLAAPGQMMGAPAPAKAPSKAEPSPHLPDPAFAEQIPMGKPVLSPQMQRAAGRPAALPLPVAVLAHVAVSYQRGSGSAQQRAVQLVYALRAKGFDAADPEPAADVLRPQISYFFTEDGITASTMARMLAGIDPAWARAKPFQSQAFSGVLPRPGSIALAVPADKSELGRHA